VEESVLRQQLAAHRFGGVLYFFDTISSTNDYAKALAVNGSADGAVVVADSQSAGRGSGNRGWLSPPGTGVWLSCIQRPSFHPRRIRETGILAAYSIASVLREKYAAPVSLKWPNDIVLGGKKIGGLLSEGSAAGDRVSWLVTGLGINVNTAVFLAELQPRATSLFLECGRLFNREDLIAAYLERLETEYERYITEGSLEHIIPACNALLIHRGQFIRLVTPKEETLVFSEGITRFGELRVRQPGGTIRAIGIGEVSVRGPEGYI
jgi:BirA family biotin operon repressor/biotin-[acetyl-CoA-carboxylase] ligase